MADLQEKILNAFEEKPMIWWRYIDDIFFIWKHREESVEKILNKLNSFYPTIKFTFSPLSLQERKRKEKTNFRAETNV